MLTHSILNAPLAHICEYNQLLSADCVKCARHTIPAQHILVLEQLEATNLTTPARSAALHQESDNAFPCISS